jgi:hypothetical protein
MEELTEENVMQKRNHTKELVKRLRELYGDELKTITLDLKYTEEVQAFINKINQAHENAANSTLRFK